MKKVSFLIAVLICTVSAFAQYPQQPDTLSFIFMGDIMGHDGQINSAYNDSLKTYEYDQVFAKVAPIIRQADFAIANLEVTLAGPPYKGYPQFSSPDQLVMACQNSGIDVLVTSNNHSCDGRKKGVLRTINVLDSLNIKHTGTFKDSTDRAQRNLLVLEKNNIKVGLLNYTYGTNGLPTPKPTIVNRIDKALIKADIEKSKSAHLDKLIIMLHWGLEYQSQPSEKQKELATYLFDLGVDVIVGSHPHVLQKMTYSAMEQDKGEQLIAYSLGNFVSNQRTRKRDGGAMLAFSFIKENDEVRLNQYGYYLTWVHKPKRNNKTYFEILPCAQYEANDFMDLDEHSKNLMKRFLSDSRTLYGQENEGVAEIKQ